MGFSIGSLVSDLTDPGKLVGDLANSVLPSNMKAVGEMLGGITDLNAGNPLAALSHLTDALKDLPQLLQSLSGAAGGAAGAAKPAGTAAAEPTPPPVRTTTTDTPSQATTPATTTPASSTPAAPPAPAATSGTSSTPASATPSSAAKTAPTPTVTVTNSRGSTVTQVDDGTNTTRVTQRADGLNTVVVMNDATGKTVGSYTGAATNVTIGGEHVNIGKRPGETLTSVDNGTNTATVDQKWTGTTISSRADAPPSSPSLGPGTNVVASTSAGGTAATAPPTTLATLLHELKLGLAPSPSAQASAGSSAPKGTSSSSSAGGTPATTSSSSSAGGSSSASSSGTTSGAGSSSGSSSATPTDLKSLMALSPDQFEQAVTSGKIPDDVANSQSAMMQVQARMNQITQMNQLVTGMMAAMHQMQMSIIQNIRC